MGNRTTRSSLRNAIVHLNISAQAIRLDDDKFWDQVWTEDQHVAEDVIKGIRVEEIRMLRDGSPSNFAALVYKLVERLYLSTGTLCNTQSQQIAVLNSVRILIRVIPCIFEDKGWRTFFEDNCLPLEDNVVSSNCALIYPEKNNNERNYVSYLPQKSHNFSVSREEAVLYQTDKSIEDKEPLREELIIGLDVDGESSSIQNTMIKDSTGKSFMTVLLSSICDLLFCPEFTVGSKATSYLSNVIDAPPEDIRSLASFEYVWEPGVGFESNASSTTSFDKSRSELLKLLLTSTSSVLYSSSQESTTFRNPWLELLISEKNRHALPLFTSLLNTIFSYNPSKLSLSNLFYQDVREELVEVSIQILNTTFVHDSHAEKCEKNLFIDYLSRIHRDEDLSFLVKGFARLLNCGLDQGYLLTKQVKFDFELMILLWRLCNLNKKFLISVLKLNHTFDIVVPLLYHINENFQNTSKTAKIHLSVFNLLILSGERYFGVKLNEPYSANLLSNIPAFTGSHADLMIIVFHKLIIYGENTFHLFDYLLTILANVSPYLKNLTTLACKCLIQLFEIFTSPCVIFTEPNYHTLVLLLVETFNNLIQYQFDGNAHLVSVILAKKEVFKDLANLTTTSKGINKVLAKLAKRKHCLESVAKTQWKQDNDISAEKTGLEKLDPDGSQSELGSSSSRETLPSCILQNELESSIGVSLLATPRVDRVIDSTYPFLTSNSSTKTSSEHLQIEVRNSANDEPEDQTRGNIGTNTEKEFPLQNQGWRPSPDWVKNWKKSLPLHTTLRMIEVLEPQFEALGFSGMNQQSQIELTNKFMNNGTLVGLLPVPHPILIRKYKTSEDITRWLRACTWGIIYVRYNIWQNTYIRLIKPL